MEINDWVLSGGGVQGCNYFSESHPELVLKVYAEHIPREYVENELKFCKAFKACGFSCPDVYEVVEYQGRYGILCQRIHNKKSFCKASGESHEVMERFANRMAEMIRPVHEKSAEGTPFTSFLGIIQELLDNNIWIDDSMHKLLQDTIDELALRDRKTLLHGDFHFGNVINDGKCDYFIDLGCLSYGHPDFDISMFYLVTHYGSEEMNQFTFHLSCEQMSEFWNLFKKAYYGRDIPDEELFPELRKYLLLRTVWIQTDTDNSELSRILMDMFSKEDCPHFCLLENIKRVK